MNISPIKEVPRLFLTKIILLIKKLVNSIVAVTEMYRRIHWGLVADPLGFAEHSFGTTYLEFVACFSSRVLGRRDLGEVVNVIL